jgi:cyclase
MLKKRIIFTLIYSDGYFMLSRNFRLQRVGNDEWLKKNYDFSSVSSYIDELIVLDVSRGQRDKERFCTALKSITRGCFVPIAAGGGVRSVDDARRLLRSGADKIVVNSPLFNDPELTRQIAQEFGQQCVVGSIDIGGVPGCAYQIAVTNGAEPLPGDVTARLKEIDYACIGEIYLNSIARDGTGQGYDFKLLDLMPHGDVPIILAGGVGNANHLREGLEDPRVDAVATAHLFNFVGNGLRLARESILAAGFDLASWPGTEALTSLSLRGAASR